MTKQRSRKTGEIMYNQEHSEQLRILAALLMIVRSETSKQSQSYFKPGHLFANGTFLYNAEVAMGEAGGCQQGKNGDITIRTNNPISIFYYEDIVILSHLTF